MLQAIEAYSAIIDCLLPEVTVRLSQSQVKWLDEALCQRASIYEYLEAYEASLQDYCQLLKLQHSHALVSKAQFLLDRGISSLWDFGSCVA